MRSEIRLHQRPYASATLTKAPRQIVNRKSGVARYFACGLPGPPRRLAERPRAWVSGLVHVRGAADPACSRSSARHALFALRLHAFEARPRAVLNTAAEARAVLAEQTLVPGRRAGELARTTRPAVAPAHELSAEPGPASSRFCSANEAPVVAHRFAAPFDRRSACAERGGSSPFRAPPCGPLQVSMKARRCEQCESVSLRSIDHRAGPS